jgi:copper chaperone CopZ
MPDHRFKIGGLKCQGCADSVRSILKAQKGVADVSVDLAAQRATVAAHPDFDPAAAGKAVAQAGFSLAPD